MENMSILQVKLNNMSNNLKNLYYRATKNNPSSNIYREWRTRNDVVIDFFKKIEDKFHCKVLEIGAGRGFMTKFLSDLGFDIVGSDFNPHNLEMAREINGIKLKMLDAIHISEPDCRYNIVLAVELIEHLEDIMPNILEVKRILRPDGLYLITTPNKYIEKIYNTLLRKKKDPFHISLQTHKTLKKKLISAGFAVKFLKMKSFTISQQEKIGKVARFIPLNYLPKILQPTIVCVAMKKNV